MPAEQAATNKKPAVKKAVDIEALVRWAYLDELSKRATSSAEGIWDGIREWGQKGGIDVGHGAAQRYPHFGLPHADAEAIEIAIGALAGASIDWHADFDWIAGDLAALVTIDDFRGKARAAFDPADAGSRLPGPRSGFDQRQIERAPVSDFTYTRDGGRAMRGLRVKAPRHGPRDVIMVNTIDAAALVVMHAVKGTRPDGWRVDDMRPLPTRAEGGKLNKVIGTLKGKNRYTTGSYCPLVWAPSPITIVQARADYVVWHRALARLAETLLLSAHDPSPPAASLAPWCEDTEKKRPLWSQPFERLKPLPLAAPRDTVSAPIKKARHSKVRRVPLDEGKKT
jgi:hypothetical protein